MQAGDVCELSMYVVPYSVVHERDVGWEVEGSRSDEEREEDEEDKI